MKNRKYLISIIALFLIAFLLCYKTLFSQEIVPYEDTAARKEIVPESPDNSPEHRSIDIKSPIPAIDETKDTQSREPTNSVDEQLKAQQGFHAELVQLVRCENIEKTISSAEMKNYENDLLLSGASNGEIFEYVTEVHQTYETCKKYNLDENRKTSHDLALELFLSGDIRGLYYLTSMVLPKDFDEYTEGRKAEYRNYMGELLHEQVVRCEKMAIDVYGNGIGAGTHWSEANNNKSQNLVNYEKQLLMDFLKRKEGSDEPPNIELVELSSKLSPEELQQAGQNTETIFKNCFKRKSQ